jgi:hypothetical protein
MSCQKDLVVLDEAIVVRNEGLRNFTSKQRIRGHGVVTLFIDIFIEYSCPVSIFSILCGERKRAIGTN